MGGGSVFKTRCSNFGIIKDYSTGLSLCRIDVHEAFVLVPACRRKRHISIDICRLSVYASVCNSHRGRRFSSYLCKVKRKSGSKTPERKVMVMKICER